MANDNRVLEQRDNVSSTKIESGFPKAKHALGRSNVTYVTMKDGTLLKTFIHFPEGEGPWPVIVVRNPYFFGEEDMNGDTFKSFTQYGYAVVYQHCRGRGGSEGEWFPVANERDDGMVTLDWLIQQPWMNGSIGLFGGSYLSMVHWSVADSLPTQVKAACLSIYGPNHYEFLYMNGMFKHDVHTKWAAMNSGLAIDTDPKDIYIKSLQIKPHIQMDEKLLGKELPWYREYVMHPDPHDSFWSEGVFGELHNAPSKMKVPVLMIGGWFDIGLGGMERAYNELPEEIRRRSKMVIGPWEHSFKPTGDLDYPNGGPLNFIGSAIEWFNSHLKPNGEDAPQSGVMTYIIGDDKWKTWENWPPASHRLVMHLQAPENNHEIGKLVEQVPPQERHLTFTYDPRNPVPTIGGSVVLAGGIQDERDLIPGSLRQPKPGYRNDVVTFLSAVLDQDLLIGGKINFKLSVSTEAVDTAFTVKVMEVFSDGEAYNIADGITALSVGSEARNQDQENTARVMQLQLWPTVWKVKKGSRIRLDVSSSNYPAYHVHPNVSGIWAETAETRKAEQTIYTGGNHACFMELPIIECFD